MAHDGRDPDARTVAPDGGDGQRRGWRRFDAAVLGFEPLGSKLRPALPHLALVSRLTLLATLTHSSAPLVLVSAPAGSGKSTALMQWVDAEQRSTSWLVLDEGDNDLVALTRYLALSLAEVAPVDPAVFELLARPRPPVHERVVPRLAASLSEASPFLLVLDDGQLVHKRECWRVIAAVLDAVPDGAQLALGTREDPPLPLGRLRAAGGLAEVRMDQLAMDEEETAAFLRLQGVVMTDGEVKTILGVTEGWAAGVYLATLVAETLPPDEWVAHVRGDQVEIARYLTDEVLRRLPAETRRFMAQTSILDRLGAGIARKNLFVSALDDHGECYRYQQLFAELLRTHLKRLMPDELPRLHRLAAAWYESHGAPEAAVAHRLAAGDVREAVGLVKDECVKLYRQESDADLLLSARLLRLLDPATILNDPELTLIAGWTLGLVCGDREEQARWGPAACRARVDDGPCAAGAASWQSFQAILRVYLAPDGVSRMLEDAELAFGLERDRDRGWKLEATSALGLARYLDGRAGAVGLLEAAADGCWDLGDRYWALGLLSLVHGDAGRWRVAEQCQSRAHDLYPTAGLRDEVPSPATLPPLLAHLRVASRRRDPGLHELLTYATDHVARMIPQADWTVLLASVILGEVWLEQGDLSQAGRRRDEALTILRRYPDAGMLGPRARRLARAIEERLLGEPLTKAERQILELLPTHLTAEDLAERLFVSVNTVRTHVRHIYLKLGVGTRAEAVAKARELGLISDVA
jgi:LuxR family maltose regulon positive regulatory protein